MAQTKKRRRKKSKFAKLMIFLLVLLIIAGILIALSCTVLFNIAKITVSGDTRYSAEEIIAASGIKEGSNMNLLDTDASGKRVCKKLPYIGTAEISRKYPDTITIKVKETKADGVYRAPKGYVLVSGRKVVEESSKRPEGLPLITAELKQSVLGNDISLADGMNEAVDKIYAEAERVEIKDITAINVKNLSEITVECGGRIVLQLGTTENIGKKMSNAAKIMETQRKKYGNAVEGYVNLRYLTGDANRSYFTRKSIEKQ